jgi:hypothetical protein
MRRTWVVAAVALAASALAGCSSDDGGEPAALPVTTPPPSATAAAPTTSAGTGTGTGSLPVPSETGDRTTATTATGTATAAPAGPVAAYQGLVLAWQQARAEFVGRVGDGRRHPVAEQRALAATFLRAQQAFVTGLQAADWPDPARRPVLALIAQNRRQQQYVAAMARAGSSGEFTAQLAGYGSGTPAENRAVAAVTSALT